MGNAVSNDNVIDCLLNLTSLCVFNVRNLVDSNRVLMDLVMVVHYCNADNDEPIINVDSDVYCGYAYRFPFKRGIVISAEI